MSEKYSLSYPQYARALQQALVEDPFYIAIGRVAGAQALLEYLDYSIVEGALYGESFFPDSDAYGVSVWSKPLSAERSVEQQNRKTEFLKNQLGETYLALYQDITGFMSAQSAPLVGEHAWYLSIVGVLPECQNRGLGVQLIGQVLDKTDALALPTFLETFTPRNESFYQRLGYRVVERPFEPTLGSAYAIMVREPQVVEQGS